jgi:hypothetical protein
MVIAIKTIDARKALYLLGHLGCENCGLGVC